MVPEQRGDICECVDWFLVAITAAEALEHNAGVSDYMGDLHDDLKKILSSKDMEDLEFRHHLLQGYITENFANMGLAGSIGTIKDKCNVDVTKLHSLALEGFDAIKKREPSKAGNRFTQVKLELLRLAGILCEQGGE